MVRAKDTRPYITYEAVMAIASILKINSKFYPLLVRFMTNEDQFATLAMDEAESAYEHFVSVHGKRRGSRSHALSVLEDQAIVLQHAVSAYVRNSEGEKFHQWLTNLPKEQVDECVLEPLLLAVLDTELANSSVLKLLISHWAANELRLWVNRLKA
jgi:hypothetical protein